MAQFALGDIKYTKRAANNTVHREKLHGAIHFGRHKITQRAVNNTVHQAKLTDIGQLTLDHIHAHTHTLAQKYLIELLLWSASVVHKQSLKV